jgi:hypothetical protein
MRDTPNRIARLDFHESAEPRRPKPCVCFGTPAHSTRHLRDACIF